MKSKKILFIFISAGCLLNNKSLFSQGTWTQRTGLDKRQVAVCYSIGNFGYVGTGYYGGTLNDYWSYNPATDSWAMMTVFMGVARSSATGFSIGNKGYIVTGQDSMGNFLNDLWEYDAGTGSWSQIAMFPGPARADAVGFSIGTKGYIGTGRSGAPMSPTKYNDFWEYDPSSNSWLQKADFGGTARYQAVGFSITGKGYIGTGDDGSDKNDFWEYDPSSDNWSQKSDFPGPHRRAAVGISINNKGYIGLGYNMDIDFWEYNPADDAWTQQTDFPGSPRAWAIAFSIGNNGYIGSGVGAGDVFYTDMWEFSPTTTEIGEFDYQGSTFWFFSNPVSGSTTGVLNSNGVNDNFTLDVTDIAGRKIKSYRFKQNNLTFNANELNDGIYFLALFRNGIFKDVFKLVVAKD